MDKETEIDPLTIELIKLYMADPLAAKKKADAIAWEVIRCYKTQTEVAKKLKIIRQTFTYRINHAKTIHLEDVLKMVQLLRSEKTEIERWCDFMVALLISERAKLAIDDLAQQDDRRGRKPTQNASTNPLIRENFSHLTGRLDDIIAKKYGFSNRKKLRHAIFVVTHGCKAVIQAMDDKTIKIYLAAKLSTQPAALQRELLPQGTKIIRAYFNKEKPKSKQCNITDAVHAIKTDPLLKHIEKKTKEPIRKHIETILYSVCG